MRLIRIIQTRDVIKRFQSNRNGLLQSALILLAVSFVADSFPLGILPGGSFAWTIFRLALQAATAVILATWMWIVFDVLVDSLRKRKVSPNFPVVRAVLILSIVAMVILNGLPHSNTTGGYSFGWPFKFIYGLSVVSPFAGILDAAHALIIVALLLAVADRAISSPAAPAVSPPAPPAPRP